LLWMKKSSEDSPLVYLMASCMEGNLLAPLHRVLSIMLEELGVLLCWLS
jgi:hypothetical protein